jgi:rRNA maturation protein Rpf1
LLSQRSTYSLSATAIKDEGTVRAFAVCIAANPDKALVDLQGVDLSPHVDVLGVSDELRGNCVILEHVQAQRIAQRVKSAKAELNSVHVRFRISFIGAFVLKRKCAQFVC